MRVQGAPRLYSCLEELALVRGVRGVGAVASQGVVSSCGSPDLSHHSFITRLLAALSRVSGSVGLKRGAASAGGAHFVRMCGFGNLLWSVAPRVHMPNFWPEPWWSWETGHGCVTYLVPVHLLTVRTATMGSASA